MHSASAVAKIGEEFFRIRGFKIMPRIFLFGLQKNVAIGDFFGAFASVEVQVHDAVDALQIAGETLETIGEFAGDRRAFETGDLLKIGELRDLHAVAPAFPAKPPGAERRAFPIVLDEADVVKSRRRGRWL